MDKENESVIT
jgi:hypothetical protein